MVPSALTWLSTTLAKDAELQPLTMEVVRNLTRSARRVTVAAAYWDEKFLTDLLDAIPASRRSRVKFRLFLNGFTGQRGDQDAHKLRKLARKWRKRGLKNFDIQLVVGGRLFHAKILLFEGTKQVHVLVGSANATDAAFSENEEVMLMLRAAQVPDGLDEYLSAVAAKATPVDAVDRFEAHTLASFLRMGSVYYKPSVVTQFRFNLRLPPNLRAELTTLQLEIPEMTAQASQTYNPFVGIGLTPDEERELAELTEADDAPSGGKRISISSYGVQTCYGWWVPVAYDEELKRKLKPVCAKQRVLLGRLSSQIENEKFLIRRRARSQFKKLEQFAKKNGFELPETARARMTRFNEFLRRTGKRLADPTWRKRAEQPYVRASVPEMWSDPMSSGQFIETFFDYLEFVTAPGKRSLVWKSLHHKLDHLYGGPTSRDIKEALQAYIEHHGWTDDDWQLPQRNANKASGRRA